MKNPIFFSITSHRGPPRIDYACMKRALTGVHFGQHMSNCSKGDHATEPMHPPFGMLIVNVTILQLEENVARKGPRFPCVQRDNNGPYQNVAGYPACSPVPIEWSGRTSVKHSVR